MSRRNFRSFTGRSTSGRSFAGIRKGAFAGSAAGTFLTRAGKALGMNPAQGATPNVEHLEQRQLLEGSFASPILLPGPNIEGVIVQTGDINPASAPTNNDTYSFVAPMNGFVSVLADTANEASNLDTRVAIFNTSQAQIAAGSNNDTLTSGPQRDGWTGFIAQAGQTYFVRVSSEAAASGTYTLRIRTANRTFDIGGDIPTETGIAREAGAPVPDATAIPPVLPQAILGQLGGLGPAAGRLRQDEIVFKYVAPSGAAWNSLVTVNAQSTDTNLARRLDTRTEVYTSAGVRIAADSDTGRSTDAFTFFAARAGETYYIRVRSDEVRGANINLATGPFFLVLDALPDTVAVDRVTRRGQVGRSFDGFDPSIPAPDPNIPTPAFQTRLYKFTAAGDLRSFITVVPRPFNLPDSALRIVNTNGQEILFNNDFIGRRPQLEVSLSAGQDYYVIVDGFAQANVGSGTGHTLFIETSHQNTSVTDVGTDDHQNNPFQLPVANQPSRLEIQRQFQRATALTWSGPLVNINADDAFNLGVGTTVTPTFALNNSARIDRDRGSVVQAFGTGRLFNAADTDLFQFTPQIDMQSVHGGNNNDDPSQLTGTGHKSLFIGGRFQAGEFASAFPTKSQGITIFDGGDYWYNGPQFTRPGADPVTFGFADNVDTAATAGPEIYAMYTLLPTTAGGMQPARLIVGGDFTLVIPNPIDINLPPTILNNLATYSFDGTSWGWGDDFGTGTNGPVRAITQYDPVSFDPDGSGPAMPVPDPGTNDLFIGGTFTEVNGFGGFSNIASFTQAGSIENLNGGVAGPVNAFQVYNAGDPGAERAAEPMAMPPLPFVRDTPDLPISLYIGGSFGADGGLKRWDGLNYGFAASGTPTPTGIVAGTVYALSTFIVPDTDGEGGIPETNALVIAGDFTSFNGDAARNFVLWGFIDEGDARFDSMSPLYGPRLLAIAPFTTLNGAVRALATWDQPDIVPNGQPRPVVLAYAGDFFNEDNGRASVRTWDGINGEAERFTVARVTPAGNTVRASVRSLSAFVDTEEPLIESNLDGGNPQEVLYVGGDFNRVFLLNPAAPPIVANNVAQYGAVTGPFAADDSFTPAALNGGVGNLDAALANSSVFVVHPFNDGNLNEWDRHDRPATRMSIAVSPAEGSFGNMRVRVYDSRLRVIYDYARPGSETISPIAPDPAGMTDPSLVPPLPAPDQALFGLTVWGGETYYIEISDVTAEGVFRGTTGRYNFVVTTDAAPYDQNGDGVLEDVNAGNVVEAADEGNFSRARQIFTPLGSGDATNQLVTSNPPLAFPGNRAEGRTQRPHPSFGGRAAGINLGSDLGNIHKVDDTDIYFFRAEFTGTAEVRVTTTLLQDAYGETDGPEFTSANSLPYMSSLDAALRIFDNDFEQISYNDDNTAWRIVPNAPSFFAETIAGDYDLAQAGTQTRLFRHADPRVVFNVVAGTTYYIQVESGVAYADGELPLPPLATDPTNPLRRTRNIAREIDPRGATGSYEVLLNQMAQQISDIENGTPTLDDHSNLTNIGGVRTETMIPLGPGTPGGGSILGTVTGLINNTPNNPFDFDVFGFTAPANGTYTIRLIRTGTNNSLVPILGLIRPLYFPPAADVVVTQGTVIANGGRQIVQQMVQGEQFIIPVQGESGSEGTYRIEIAGPGHADDHADFDKWFAATDVPLNDSQGRGTAQGRIEFAGDTDIFRFRFPNAFDAGTIQVQALDPTFNPTVTIFEVSEDTAGNPVYLRLGFNDDIDPNDPDVPDPFNLNARVTVPLNSNRTTGPVGAPRTYPYYYVLVQDSDIAQGLGAYQLSINFTSGDDHADGDSDKNSVFDTGEFPVATNVIIDNTTGLGTIGGNIEDTTDDDLFVFVAPTSGPVTFVVNPVNGSLLRSRITLLDANANILDQATAGDTPFGLALLITRTMNAGDRIYVSVSGFEDAGTPNVFTNKTGTYELVTSTQPRDDHPNRGEFNIATVIPLSSLTGAGQIGTDIPGQSLNPRLTPANDTDLFTFRVIETGNVRIILSPYNTALGQFAGSIEVYRSTDLTTPIATITGGVLQEISINLPGATKDDVYFVLVSAFAGFVPSDPTGEYRLRVEGARPTVPVDPDPASINFNSPSVILLSGRTGDGSTLGRVTNPQATEVSPAQDRDLYSFTTAGIGRVFVRVWTPEGSLLDASVEVLRRNADGTRTRIAFDADGTSGSTAFVSFGAFANETYFVIVDGLGDSTGAYAVEVNSAPSLNRLVYPEGFAGESVFEFIPIANPNPFAVDYTVRLRYESGDLETVFPTRRIGANTRDGVTITEGANRPLGVRANTPYSLIIEWAIPAADPQSGAAIDPTTVQPLGATLSHYDFGSSTGDAFTERVSTRWSFPRVERSPGGVLNFLLFYNPNAFAVDVTATAYMSDGRVILLPATRRAEAGRREGFGINDFADLGVGVFSVVLNANVAPEANGLIDPLKAAAFEGIVASLTAYTTTAANTSAFATLGDPDGGSREGVVTNVQQGSGVESEVVLFNPGSSPATVTLNGSYIRAALPNFSRTLDIMPGRTVRLTGTQLGLTSGQPAGVSYTASAPISFTSVNVQKGDADASTAQYAAGTNFSFGDAYINIDQAGRQYFETLYFYNPSNQINTITIDLLFFDRVNGRGSEAATRTITISVQPGRFAAVNLHERAEVLTNRKSDGNGAAIFAIDINGTSPFVTTMTHYDLFLGGGWGAAPTPFGIVTPLTAIG